MKMLGYIIVFHTLIQKMLRQMILLLKERAYFLSFKYQSNNNSVSH